MVDESHGETIIKANDFKTKNVQLDLAKDKNESQSNSEAILATQLVSIGTSIDRQVDEEVQPNLVGMFVKYGTLGFIHEVGLDTTQIGDVGDDFILILDYYQEGKGVEYSLEHEDSMEVHIVKLVHALATKTKDVKQSYGKRIQ